VHEFSLMSSMMDTVRESAVQNNIMQVEKIKLVIGKLSMALPDSLQFAFEALKKDELFQEAVLEIEEKEITCLCSNCQQSFMVNKNYYFVCPECASNKVEIIGGRELYIDFFEGE